MAEGSRSRSFVLHRLHSLSGLFPIGVFMLAELWVHAKSVAGPEAHRQALDAMEGFPALWLVLLPLSFHAGYGAFLTLRPSYEVEPSPLQRGWLRIMQRASGMAALVFIGLHATQVWLPRELGAIGTSELHDVLVRLLSTTHWHVPWMAFAYVLGIGACTLHLALGIWTFSIRWNLVASKRARARTAALAIVVGMAMFLFGARTVLYLATGWRIGGAAETPSPALCPP